MFTRHEPERQRRPPRCRCCAAAAPRHPWFAGRARRQHPRPSRSTCSSARGRAPAGGRLLGGRGRRAPSPPAGRTASPGPGHRGTPPSASTPSSGAARPSSLTTPAWSTCRTTPHTSTRCCTTAPSRCRAPSAPARAAGRRGSASPASAISPSPRRWARARPGDRQRRLHRRRGRRARPLFHLMNGDLCYANVSDEPVETWTSSSPTTCARRVSGRGCSRSTTTRTRSRTARRAFYQTRFELFDNGSREFRGNWYSFTAGLIRVISLNNDDVCLQDGGFSAFRRDNVPGHQAHGDNPHHRIQPGLQRTG